MPQRFEVYDMLRKPITSGLVSDDDGAALWECASVAAGAYIITIFDHRGDSRAREPIVRQQCSACHPYPLSPCRGASHGSDSLAPSAAARCNDTSTARPGRHHQSQPEGW